MAALCVAAIVTVGDEEEHLLVDRVWTIAYRQGGPAGSNRKFPVSQARESPVQDSEDVPDEFPKHFFGQHNLPRVLLCAQHHLVQSSFDARSLV